MLGIIQRLIGCKVIVATSANLQGWWHKEVDKDWNSYREEAMRILQAEDELKNIVKLVGPEALPEKQRLILETARMIRIALLAAERLRPSRYLLFS